VSAVPDSAEEQDNGASLNRSLARAVAGIVRKHVGIGPKKADAFFHKNYVVVVMVNAMTPQERSLIADDGADMVEGVRNALQHSMRKELSQAVAALTGAKVVGFMSGSQLVPSLAAEVFVLDRPVRLS
jgi:uncharacterized protein YbcI